MPGSIYLVRGGRALGFSFRFGIFIGFIRSIVNYCCP